MKHHFSRRLLIGALPSELTPAQVALECGVVRQSVYNWMQRPTDSLPSYIEPICGRRVVSATALREWLGLTIPEVE
jgi:hypothetical protein